MERIRGIGTDKQKVLKKMIEDLEVTLNMAKAGQVRWLALTFGTDDLGTQSTMAVLAGEEAVTECVGGIEIMKTKAIDFAIFTEENDPGPS